MEHQSGAPASRLLCARASLFVGFTLVLRGHHAGKLLECGACENRCPYNLPIRQMLKKVAADFGE